MSPFERSRKVLEGLDVRRVLEHSGLPVEIATALADVYEASLRPEAALKREDIIEECARVCDLLAGLNVQGWGRKSTSAAQKCATEIRALK